MKQVLLYNLNNEKGKQIEDICSPLHIGIQHILPEAYLEQIGAIAGYPGFARKGTPPCTAVFSDEMLLFSECMPREIHALLNAFRNAGIRIAIKASLTRHNVHWNSLQLHKELLEEQKALG